MADLGKVIKGLELCAGNSTCKWGKCPYNPKHIDHPNYPACRIELENDALSLLKAQRPMMIKEMKNVGSHLLGTCPSCEKILMVEEHPNFCGRCGQAVKWE